ncbi:DEAD/DEAH box helicase family protein [Wolbachia endosymbiont of Ctenocephalides felis wCfeJ]|uniref:DEAD/DEAH box helicase family protein n=1 Tax=Wolbachia endosymbiont of Ctenocephalides felis wCfeJ TaxID=2732594 RepID=UPI0014473B03|nr:DEAD/DEAH box helicase family protein [Wolbachia endosymbiont of Ctenocephalides felis wCfeJ]WCR58334.1 MAG: hypothetical protein PG980_000806 [Wolbachia endosymbiont of Ctenocephalides felis wCfeJ]
MSSISSQEKQNIISHLEEVNRKLQGERVNFNNKKESIIVKRRKPAVEGTLKHLKNSSTTNCNIMIDAETGFGKTYDIGLWSYVLTQAGFHHLIAVPSDNLVNQAKEMIGSAFTVDIKTPKTMQEIKDTLRTAEPTTIIVTHDLLLRQENDRKFKGRNGEKPKLWVSIDEADSINRKQDFDNVCELDEEYPTTYLTATPKRRILNRCRKIISPIRSSRRCIANVVRTEGVITKTNRKEKFIQALVINVAVYSVSLYTLFPVVRNHVIAWTTKIGLITNHWLNSFLIFFLADIVSSLIFHVVIIIPLLFLIGKITGVGVKALFSRFAANLANLVDKEKSSPAHGYVEECEEIFNYNKLVDTDDLLTSVRWNIQSPIGENALILVDDIDSIINLNFALQGNGRSVSKGNKIYEHLNDNLVREDGKIYTRYKVYDKFKPEGALYRDYRLQLRQSNFINCIKKQHPGLTQEQISELKEKVDFSNTAKYLKYRVMHSIIDLTLSYLTKHDNIALDKQRRDNLDELVKDVRSNAITSSNHIINFLKERGFSEQFAIDKLLPQIKTTIKALARSNDKQYRLIVDNWHLSKELHDLIEKENGTLHDLNDFCEKNKCIFARMGKNNLGIDEGRPFFRLYDYEITPGKDKCKADYCSYDQSDLNALAKHALTTIVDGSKGRGFDSEYNHIASIFVDSTSQFNNPAEVLQNLGRNREFNVSRQPWFFAAAGKGAELFINKVLAKLNNAPRDFCKKLLFPAANRYNKLIKSRMGVELGEKIEAYISENIDALGNIDAQKLKDFCEDKVSKAYEKVHDINDFDTKKTEKDLREILKSAEKYLCSCEDRIKNNGKLSLMNRGIFFATSIIFKAVYYIWFAFDYVIFMVKSCTLNEKNDGQNVLTYAHIIKNYSLETVLRSEKILYKAFEAAEDTHQDCKSKSYYISNHSECMEKIVDLFQNKIYINALDKLFSPFLLKKEGDSHLLTTLNAIYPDEIGNEEKRGKIINFKNDLKELKREELVRKYCQGNTYQDTNLCKIVKWITDINKEVTKCQAYYHSVNELINVDEPRLKTDHHLFNIRVVYSQETLSKSYNRLRSEHPKLLFFARLNCLARYIIVVLLFPYLLGFVTPIGSTVVSIALVTLTICYPEKFREFLFDGNIQNESCSAVNELDLFSKQDEVKCVREAANMVAATNLSSILVQQQSRKGQESCQEYC